ncbi:ABC transporter substrate-binding protein [SAR202 cluster bacterium AD-804-J14_MRT_500m]|nr:ABC transporter substrate-binding protein [SAR202 cluster bacterium AD-804-J14_MRT_500m]
MGIDKLIIGKSLQKTSDIMVRKTLLFIVIGLWYLTGCMTGSSLNETINSQTFVARATAVGKPTTYHNMNLLGDPGGRLTTVVTSDIASRDVQQEISETLAVRGPGIVYSRLMRLSMDDSTKQPSILLECELCLNWEVSDLLTYKFNLRTDVKWQDIYPVNGRKLLAKDLKFSYERQLTKGWPNATPLKSIEDVVVGDEYTLRIELRYPEADFLLGIADGHSKIVPMEVVEGDGGLKNGPVIGSGPWKWLKTENGVGSSFEANKDYFEENAPYLERLDFLMIQDPAIGIAAFLTGSLDLLDVPLEILKEYGDRIKGFPFRESHRGGGGPIIAVNSGEDPFNDASLRRALIKSLDPVSYRKEIWNGKGFLGAGIPVVSSSGLLGNPWIEDLFHKPEEARQLLDGRSPQINLLVADFGLLYLELGYKVEQDLRAVGFSPIMKAVSPLKYAELLQESATYHVLIGPVPPASGPNGYLYSAYHSLGKWNLLNHSNTMLDELIEEQSSLGFDSASRGELIKSIQRLLLEEGYVFSPVNQTTTWLLQDNVRGFAPNEAASEYFYWAKLWLERN